MSNPNAVGQAFIQLDFQTDPAKLTRTAQQAAQAIEQKINRGLAQTNASTQQLSRNLQQATRNVQPLTRQFSQLQNAIGFSVTAAAGFTFVQGIKAAAQVETITLAFERLFPNIENATARVVDFAKETPFSLDQITKSVQKLAAAGIPFDKTFQVLTTVGDAAAVSGADLGDALGRVSLALTQILGRGRLAAEELNQISEVIPGLSRLSIFEEIAKSMGVATSEVQKLAEEGLVPGTVAVNAILEAASKIPGALGAMDAASQTFTGQFSILRENITLGLATAFQPLADFLKIFISLFNRLSPDIQAAIVAAGSLTIAFGAIAVAVSRVNAEIAGMGGWSAVLLRHGKALTGVGLAAAGASILLALFGKETKDTVERVKELGGAALNTSAALQQAFDLRDVDIPLLNRDIAALNRQIQETFKATRTDGQTMREAFDLSTQLRAQANFAEQSAEAEKKVREGLETIVKANLISEAREIVLGVENTEVRERLTRAVEKAFQAKVKEGQQQAINNQIFADAINPIDLQAQAQEALAKAQDQLRSKIQGVVSAQERLTSAQKSATSAAKDLQEAEAALAALRAGAGAAAAREIADAEGERTRLGRRLTDIQRQQLETEQQLAEARQPATADELAEGEDAVTRARIQLAQATREAQQAEEDFNQTQTHRINLAGLSLDEIRTQLANLKRSLAAQKAVEKATESTGKTQAEIEEEALEKQLNIRDAQRQLNEALERQQALKEQGTRETSETISLTERLVDLDLDRKDALQDIADKDEEIRRLRSGDTQVARDIRDAEEERADAAERSRDASQDAAEAGAAYRDAIRTARGDQVLITEELRKQLALAPELFTELLVPLSQLLGVGGVGVLTKDAFKKRVADALRAMGINVPAGFKDGGIVTGSGAFGTLIRAGEFGKPEAVLPLTDRFNFARTFENAYRVASPGVRQQMAPALASQPKLNLSKATRTGSSAKERQETKRMIREAFVEALQDAGVIGGTSNDIDINLNSTGLDERQLAWIIDKKIRRQLGRR